MTEMEERPVTGLPGRTPREEIALPRTSGREIEVIMVLDVSGSNDETWVAQADETAVVAVAVVGYGPGHDEAVGHYKTIAAANRYVTVLALTGVCDPAEVAFDLRLLSGTAS